MRFQWWMRASLVAGLLVGCGGTSRPSPAEPKPPIEPAGDGSASAPTVPEPTADEQCGGKPLRVAFYDAGQALAALVTLPDGKKILVDAGESPTRAGCGAPCKEWHSRVLAGLTKDVGEGGRIDMVWNTHPHSDHLGGLPGVAAKFEIGAYVHNGRDTDKASVKKAIDAATADKATVTVIEPGSTKIPLYSEDVKLTAIVPDQWDAVCASDANACSILLRIDYCGSSILFTGDAEKDEEPHVKVGAVSLLQVGHHGSDTSSTADFLTALKPTYAVISSGRQGDGTNKTYCHPIRSTVDALNLAMGGVGAGTKTLRSFDGAASGVKCNKSKPNHWVDAPAHDNIWSTSRDGTIVLTTNGDGKFAAELGQ